MSADVETMHSRVTPAGQAMGRNAARLADMGRDRLERMGLSDVKAPGLRDEMCKTCACKLGTVPNGCMQTQMDLLKAAAEGKPFLCHSPKNGQLCAGWVRVRAELVANPLPPQAMALIARWEYSPPDDEPDMHSNGGNLRTSPGCVKEMGES